MLLGRVVNVRNPVSALFLIIIGSENYEYAVSHPLFDGNKSLRSLVTPLFGVNVRKKVYELKTTTTRTPVPPVSHEK